MLARYSRRCILKFSSFQVEHSSRNFSSCQYYITTPIFYVNSSPHIGHVYTLLLADALNIHQRLKLNTKNTIFSTGTDEHGLKVQTSAHSKGLECKEFCDANSNKFKVLFDKCDTTLTSFIRTTDEQHIEAVKSVWSEIEARGFIYKSNYNGWYCTSDETFVPDSQVTKKETSEGIIHVDQNDNKLIQFEEVNYMFKLSEFVDRISFWLRTKKPFNEEKFNQEAIRLAENSGDLSVSRPRNRLSWGVEVPNDPSQNIYVWLDALTNYLTVVGYPKRTTCDELTRWPIDCQVIGKDIIKFHAVYWPSFLMALSLSLPKKFICHSHWLIDSMKMSKSRGNVVDPMGEIKSYTTEGLRYYILRASTPHSDTDYSKVQAERRINAELADTYGNLLSRCCAPALNPEGIVPIKLAAKNDDPIVADLIGILNELKDTVDEHYANANFYRGVDQIMSALRLNHTLFERSKPWKLIKESVTSPAAKEKYHRVLAITFENLRICSILLQPIIPKTSNLALDKMNVESRLWADAKVSLDIDCEDKFRYISRNSESVIFRRLKTNNQANENS